MTKVSYSTSLPSPVSLVVPLVELTLLVGMLDVVVEVVELVEGVSEVMLLLQADKGINSVASNIKKR